MKQKFLTLFLIGLLISCGGADESSNSTSSEVMESTPSKDILEKTYEVPDEMHTSFEETKDGKEVVLLGAISDELLRSSKTYSWFVSGYDSYTPNEDVVEQMAEALKYSNVQIIMGTWCEDSHVHVPALFKILDQVGLERSRIEMVAVNRDKNEPVSFIENIEFEFVPTIIIYGDEGEIGRIVENPSNATLEEDLAAILQIN